LSAVVPLTWRAADCLIEVSSAISHRSVIFLSGQAQALTRSWPTRIIGLEPWPSRRVSDFQDHCGTRPAPIAEYAREDYQACALPDTRISAIREPHEKAHACDE